MLLVVRGTALFVTDGFPQRTWSARPVAGQSLVGDFYIGPFRVYALAVLVLGAAMMLGYVLDADRSSATGSRRPAAMRRRRGRAASMSTASRSWLFVLTAVMSAFAGIISSIRTSAANPNSGTGYELEVIAMVVIGGTALTGGRGTIIGTVLGISFCG